MSTTATIFTLFLVTTGADVKHTTYESRAACEEARSLALYGQTVEAKKAADEEARRRQAEQDARQKADDEKWAREHPDVPATTWQRATLKDGARVKDAEHGSDDVATFDEKAGIVKHRRYQFWYATTPSTVVYPSPYGYVAQQPTMYVNSNDIRTAECVIVP